MINIAEILKDCPKGMELNCTICNGVKFIELDRNPNYPIVVRANNGYEFTLTKYGQVHNIDDAKCVIFPKGKTTWEGFQRPFEDGDIISNGLYVAIFHKSSKPNNFVSSNVVYYYCWYYHKYNEFKAKIDYGIGTVGEYKYATEEEKRKLFDAINENGYKWNAETKTLEKLVEPMFNVGDRVRLKLKPNYVYTIHSLAWDDNKRLAYRLLPNNDKHLILVSLNAQNDYELVSNKFDVATLKPFDKVLMRSSNAREWVGTIYSHYSNGKFYGCGTCCDQCIPFEGNERLCGTTDDCDKYFKTWE